MAEVLLKKTPLQRQQEASRIRSKYPDRVPIVVLRDPRGPASLPQIDKTKYLVPSSMTCGEFLYVIRTRLRLNPSQAMFLFVGNNILPKTSDTMSEIYSRHRGDDDFLWCTYCAENTLAERHVQARLYPRRGHEDGDHDDHDAGAEDHVQGPHRRPDLGEFRARRGSCRSTGWAAGMAVAKEAPSRSAAFASPISPGHTQGGQGAHCSLSE